MNRAFLGQGKVHSVVSLSWFFLLDATPSSFVHLLTLQMFVAKVA